MVSLKLAAIVLAALRAVNVSVQAAEPEEVLEEVTSDQAKPQTPTLLVKVSASFPQSEIFGVKLVNGHATRAVIDVENNELEPVTVSVIGGSLLTPVGMPGAPDPPVSVRNLTAQRYGVQVPPNEKETLTYSFATELHPQDLTLTIGAVIINSANELFTLAVYNGTVSVVEAPLSIFDPQIIFLYLFLAAAFGGTCYFIYTTWITTLFPQKKRGGKGGERAKRSSAGTKKVDPAEQVSVVGADGPAVTTSSSAYDESWIPAAHLKRPEAKRVGSGRPKSRAA